MCTGSLSPWPSHMCSGGSLSCRGWGCTAVHLAAAACAIAPRKRGARVCCGLACRRRWLACWCLTRVLPPLTNHLLQLVGILGFYLNEQPRQSLTKVRCMYSHRHVNTTHADGVAVTEKVRSRLLASRATPEDVHQLFLLLGPGLTDVSLPLVALLENWYLVQYSRVVRRRQVAPPCS